MKKLFLILGLTSVVAFTAGTAEAGDKKRSRKCAPYYGGGGGVVYVQPSHYYRPRPVVYTYPTYAPYYRPRPVYYAPPVCATPGVNVTFYRGY